MTLISTLAHSPHVLNQITRLAGVLQSSCITPRDREFVILHVAAFCRSRYVFAEHTPIAINAGLTETDLEDLWDRWISASWTQEQHALITFCNEILDNDSLSDQAWEAVSFQLDPPQIIELITLVGFYRMLGAFTNAVRMDLHDFAAGHTKFQARRKKNHE